MKESKPWAIILVLLLRFILNFNSVPLTTGLEDLTTHPKYMKWYWKDHEEELELIYSDENVTFYFDSHTPRNLTWPFRPLSAAWNYATNVFGPMGPDPRLYIVIHTGTLNWCSVSQYFTYFDEKFGNRTQIDCEQGNVDDWVEETPFNMDYLMEEVGRVIINVARQTGNWPAWEVERKYMRQILIYDLYIGIEEFDYALLYKETMGMTSLEKLRKKTRWFGDWYYPIYTNYGGTQVLSRFFTLLYENWPRKGWDYEKQLNIGEFVHFWSGAAGMDLTCLATRSIGLTAEDQDKLVQAKKTLTNISYSGMVDNYRDTCYKPPPFWEERWYVIDALYEHYHNLTLVFSDDNVALYFGPNMPRDIKWPFSLLSAAWNYSKATYGPFGPDPILYVVLHVGEGDGCWNSKMSSYWDFLFQHRDVIDCTQTLPENWNGDSYANIAFLVEEVGKRIQWVAKETGRWPGFQVSRWSSSLILSYDILLGIGRQEEAAKFLQSKKYTKFFDVPRKNTYWLRDFFHPIYSTYGGSKVLNRFFTLLYLHWERERNDYKKGLNVGEFVHFWSGAAGVDLTCLAIQTFGWTSENQNELDVAKTSLVNISYAGKEEDCFKPPSNLQERWNSHGDNLTLVFLNDNVACYFDNKIPRNITWPFKILSAAWGYTKSTYGPFGPDPILYIVLHIGNKNDCLRSKQDSFWDVHFRHRNVIDCTKSSLHGWNENSYANLKILVEQVGLLIPRVAKETGNWPAYKISRWSISSILTYEIYLGIGRQEDAIKFLHSEVNKAIDVPSKNTFWLRDWFYPIYSNYGGKEVLNRFFELLHLYVDKEGSDYTTELNLEEFVHFWSGAAEEDLTPIAEHAFGIDYDDALELTEAKEEYSQITYNDSTIPKDNRQRSAGDTEDQEDITVNFLHPPTFFRSANFGFEGPTSLLKRYSGSYTTVYYGDGIKATTKWPFLLLSLAWKQVLNVYENIDHIPQVEVKNLVLYLHRSTNEGCQAKWETIKSYRVPTIDCGTKVNQTWNEDSSSNRNELLTACASLIQSHENGSYGTNDKISMNQVIVFDLYLRMGRLEDAHRWLKYMTNADLGQNPVFKDILEWNLRIYTHYGGAQILNRFLLLLQLKEKMADGNKEKKLNQGELIYFWSSAAWANLLGLWKNKNEDIINEFNDARKAFAVITCAGDDCPVRSDQSDSNSGLLIGIVIGASMFILLLLSVLLSGISIYRRKYGTVPARKRGTSAPETESSM